MSALIDVLMERFRQHCEDDGGYPDSARVPPLVHDAVRKELVRKGAGANDHYEPGYLVVSGVKLERDEDMAGVEVS